MPFTVTRDGASPAIMSVKAVFALLPRHVDIAGLAHRVSRRNERVGVQLRDGSHAFIESLAYVPSLEGPEQHALALIDAASTDLVMRDFEAEVKLYVGVEAMVTCRALSKQDAAVKITQTFTGERPIDGSFEVAVDREQLIETFRAIDDGLATGNLSQLDPSVDINRIEER